jgi:predicted amidohydrolase YtcJ
MRWHLRLVLGLLAMLSSISRVNAQNTVTVNPKLVSYPAMIVYNGKIVTMDDRTTTSNLGTIVQAMAIRDGKIFALGADAAMLELAGPQTQRIDLHGHTLIPGIIDTHTHIHNNGVSLYARKHPEVLESMAKQFNVAGKTPEELRRGIEVVLKENMAHAKKDQWAFITLPNGGLDGTGPGVKFIQDHGMTAQELDKLAPSTPVLVMSHPAYMTNKAGERLIAEIYSADPDYGFELDNAGYGDLVEYARSLMVDQYFQDKVKVLADIVGSELEKNSALGITTFSSHITGLRFMDAFMKLVRDQQMPIRFAYTDYFGFEGNPDPASFYLRLGDMAGLGTDYFWQTGVGLSNIDSGPPMFCSTMEAPPEIKKKEFCRNRPGTAFEKGIYTVIRSHERLTVGHVYADKGLDYLFQTLERAMKDDPSITLDYVRSRHFSSDHCGFYPRPDQMPKLKEYGWMISCNGSIVERSAPWLKVYGMKYAKWISPVKSLIAAGVQTVYENEESWFGDPEVPDTYLQGAMFLLTRKTKNGESYAPEEAIDRVTLMKMMTSWASEYVLKPDLLGTLEPGKWADFVVFNKDYFSVPLEQIYSVYPVMTVVGGKPVFLRPEFAGEAGLKPVGPELKYANLPKSDPAGAK